MGYKGGGFLSFFHQLEKLSNRKRCTENRIASQYKNVLAIKETNLNVVVFLVSGITIGNPLSMHKHAYHCPLFESGTKTGLGTIALCRKDIALLFKHK